MERMRTDWAGNTVATYKSLPWGDGYSPSVSESAWDTNNAHFALLDHDSESNTDHAQFRQYSNMQGRWMSPGPYDGSYDAGNPQSFNRYFYVLNSPLSVTDSSGLCQSHFDVEQTCGGGGGNDYNGDDGTVDGIDEFNLLQIPVYGNGFGYISSQFPIQSWSGTVGGSPFTLLLLS
jgi:RHS repeat-associated protein